MLKPSCGELFAIAAFFDKLFFECIDLPIEQVICLVNQADQRIGAHKWIVMLKPFGVQFGSLLIGQIRLIGPMVSRNMPNGLRLRIVFGPLLLPTMPEKVLVVEQQLFKTGAGNIHKAARFGWRLQRPEILRRYSDVRYGQLAPFDRLCEIAD
jgi:hypothetical protein